MTPVLTRRKLRRKAIQSLANIFEGNGTVRSVHYSCESFYGDDDRTSRRVTAIGVYTAGNNESRGFSIAETAEALGIDKEDIEGNFEEIEKKILKDFYSMIDTTETALWLHWNMRDTYYGFRALDHRARVLGLSPTLIDDIKKVDLADVIHNLEGPAYIEHPRLENLLQANGGLPRGFMSGKEEADAFENRAYVKLHASTLSKVRAIWKIAELAASGSLKTEASSWTRHGRRPSDIGWAFAGHWLYPILAIGVGIAGFFWGIFQSF